MFGLATLDIILGLIFVYLLLSIACTAANEGISQWLNLRASTLQQGISTLLTGTHKPADPAVARAQERKALEARTAAEDELKKAAPTQWEAYTTRAAAIAPAQHALSTAAAAARDRRLEAERLETQLKARISEGRSIEITRARTGAEEARAAVRTTEDALTTARTGLDDARKALAAAEAELGKAAPAQWTALAAARRRYAEAQSASIVANLYDHPLIRGLSQARRDPLSLRNVKRPRPSYIPSPAFASALIDIIAPADAAGAGDPTLLAELRGAVHQLPPQIRKPLLRFLDDAGNDLAKARLAIAQWYEDAMERVTGLYKRKIQLITFLIAAVVCIAARADTLEIWRALNNNAALRSSLSEQAQALAANPGPDLRELIREDSIRRAQRKPAPPDTTRPDTTQAETAPTDTAASDTVRIRADSLASFRMRQSRAMIDSLQTLGVPLGWNPPPPGVQARIRAARWPLDKSTAWLGFYFPVFIQHLPGMLITILAVSLGAPFWFDMLNKIVNVRASGRAPEEKPKPPEMLPPPRGA